MTREAYIQAKIQELAEREAQLILIDQHHAECARLLNEQRQTLIERESELIQRESAIGSMFVCLLCRMLDVVALISIVYSSTRRSRLQKTQFVVCYWQWDTIDNTVLIRIVSFVCRSDSGRSPQVKPASQVTDVVGMCIVIDVFFN
jgi:hypothetical protein